jgi:uncharacterized protein YdeI (YjbR/CyaY-like superfamily)
VRIVYFESGGDFRAWLEKNHAITSELWLGFHKKDSGTPSLTYGEAVDELLCFGWIDGVRKRVDERRYTQRCTPRKPKSYWSAVNLKRYAALLERGRVSPAGKAAFERRAAVKAGRYSFENRPQNLPAAYEKTFRADKAAWAFFEAQPPGYRRTATWWIVSAAREDTRERRLAALMADSRRHRRIGLLTSKPTKKTSR